MAWEAPTVADFRERFPKFTVAVAPDPQVQRVLTSSESRVDASWGDDREEGLLLYAAHKLTLDGYAPGLEGQLASVSGAGVTSLQSGELKIGMSDRSASVTKNTRSSLTMSTGYGRQYMDLLRAHRGGPIVL